MKVKISIALTLVLGACKRQPEPPTAAECRQFAQRFGQWGYSLDAQQSAYEQCANATTPAQIEPIRCGIEAAEESAFWACGKIQ